MKTKLSALLIVLLALSGVAILLDEAVSQAPDPTPYSSIDQGAGEAHCSNGFVRFNHLRVWNFGYYEVNHIDGVTTWYLPIDDCVIKFDNPHFGSAPDDTTSAAP